MKGIQVVHLLLVVAMLFPVLAFPAMADGSVSITLEPASPTVQVGNTININIRVNNVSDLYAAEVHLTFNPALLEVLDDDAGQSGVQILPGSLFPSTRPSYVVQNTANQSTGTIDFAMTLLDPATPVSGSGTLATIRFSAKEVGTAALAWPAATSTKLAQKGGVVVAHTASGGQVIITSMPTVTPTPVPTTTTKMCTNLIENSSMEETRAWTMPITPHKADYSAADRHDGVRSIRLGIEPGSADVYSHSSAYQKIHVPANADSVTLTFWARRFTQETSKAVVDPTVDLYAPADVINGTFDWNATSKAVQYDWQEVLILQAGCYNWLATLMRDRSNDGQWTQYSYDVSAFAGQDIVVYFNVINNGWGNLRTWMYVDEVRVDACYGASPCGELVRNRSFEWTSDWSMPDTPRPANYTTDAAHSGARSARLGVTTSTWDAYSHSSVYQRIYVPSGAANPTLSFWYKAYSEDTIKTEWNQDSIDYDPAQVIRGEQPEKLRAEADWQEMLILDADYRLLSGGIVMRKVRNDGVWQQMTYNLSPFKGMTIVLYFNVINDGNGRRTWMYVDDVSVSQCGQQVHIEPASRQANVGDTFVLNVRADQIGDVYGLDTTIRFDPNVLEILSAAVGDWWAPLAPYVVANTIDNAAGAIRFAATLQNPDPALNGSGNLVAITFRAKAAGSTPVWFSALKLVNASAAVIPASSADGQVVVGAAQTQVTLTGCVLLEGRTNHSGMAVSLDGGSPATTGTDGRYTFVTTTGLHRLTFAHTAYLSSTITGEGVGGATVTLPTVTLLGGNVNGDNCVNIFDLTAVASQFGSTTPTPSTTDINGDGVVDIVDVVLVAKNFGACR